MPGNDLYASVYFSHLNVEDGLGIYFTMEPTLIIVHHFLKFDLEVSRG